ncbi:MAG: hypothetical protein ACJAYJ_002723 [Saprospiraceae bacterium]
MAVTLNNAQQSFPKKMSSDKSIVRAACGNADRILEDKK